jgi:hypothetical protein
MGLTQTNSIKRRLSLLNITIEDIAEYLDTPVSKLTLGQVEGAIDELIQTTIVGLSAVAQDSSNEFQNIHKLLDIHIKGKCVKKGWSEDVMEKGIEKYFGRNKLVKLSAEEKIKLLMIMVEV